MASRLFADVCFVEIDDSPIIPAKTGTYEGQTRHTPAKQQAFMWGGRKYPLPFTIKVPDEGPYRPGRYLVAGDVFQTGQFGLDFRTGNMRLTPVEEALAQLSETPKLKAAS